jgi:xylan 1,4-beta-xylosidase
LNVFRLFARLGAEQIEATSSGEVPLQRILSEGVRDEPDVGVLATRSDRGRVDILLWHYHDDDVPGPQADIHMVVTGLAAGGSLRVRSWRVDQENGDAFTAWKALGSPARPSRSEVDRLIAASQLAARPIRIRTRLHAGSVAWESRLPRQGVELVELTSGPAGAR